MTKQNIGYLLPPGDAYESEMQCIMLFYPDRKEYRQALFGSLDYLATWLAWEREEELRGKDAARSWRAAVELTRECMTMNYCETMLAILEDIRTNTGKYCCDVIDISDGDQYTDEVVDGEGEVPQNIVDAGYADDVDDWASFDDYKCMISHVMISNMAAQTDKYLSIIQESGAVVVTVVAVAAIAAAILATSGAVLVYGIVLGIVGAGGLYAALTEIGQAGLPNLIDAIDEHHDELACAIYNADGSASAADDLKDKIDELFNVAQATYLKALNIPAQLKALYSGRYDQQDIAQAMLDNGYDPAGYECSCDFVPEAIPGYSWAIPDSHTWNNINVATLISEDYNATTGIVTLVVSTDSNTGFEWNVVFPDWGIIAPFKHAYAWKLIEYSTPTSGDCLVRYNGRIDFHADGGGNDKWYAGYDTGIHGGSTWDDLVAQFDVVHNFSEVNHDRIRVLQDGPLTSWTEYTFIIKILGLKED